MPATPAANLAPSGKHGGDLAPGSQWLKWPVQVIRDILSPPPPPPMSQDPQVLIRQAEELLASQGWWRNLFSSSELKTDEAVKLFKSAGDLLRKYDQDLQAGRTFERTAKIQRVQLDDVMSAAITLLEAWKAYAKASPEDSVRVIEEAIDIISSAGQLNRAAEWESKLAQQFEIELRDPRRALEAYQLAAKWYTSDRKIAFADGANRKVGELLAQKGDYYGAIEAFETVFENSLRTSLSRSQCIPVMFFAGMCHVGTQDLVAFSRAVQRYHDMESSVANSSEGKYLSQLRQAWENGDEQAYEASSRYYSDILRLPPWKKQIFEKGLESIKAGGEDFS